MQHLIAIFPYRRGGDGRCAAWLLDDRLRPMAGAPVLLGGLALGQTDGRGLLLGGPLPLADGEELSAGEARLAVPYVAAGEAERQVQAVLYHDRPVYPPGGVLRFRLVALQAGQPLAGAQAVVRLLLDEGRVVGGRVVETSRCGVAAGEIPLPAGLLPCAASLVLELEAGEWRAPLRIEPHRPALLLAEADVPQRIARAAPAPGWTAHCRYGFGEPVDQGELRVALQRGQQRWETILPAAARIPLDVPPDEWRRLLAEPSSGEPLCVTLELLDRHGRSGVWARRIPVAERRPAPTFELDAEVLAPGAPLTGRVLAAPDEPWAVRLLEEELAAGRTDAGGCWEFRAVAPGALGEHLLELQDASGEILGGATLLVRELPLVLEVAPAGDRPVIAIFARHAAGGRRRSPLLVVLVDESGALCAAQSVEWSGGDELSLELEAPGPGSYLLQGLLAFSGDGEQEPHLICAGAGLRLPGPPPPAIEVEGLREIAEPGSTLSLQVRVGGAIGGWQLGGWLFDRGLAGHGDPLPETLPRALSGAGGIAAGRRIELWPVCCRNWGCSLVDVALPPFGDCDGSELPPPGRAPEHSGAYPDAVCCLAEEGLDLALAHSAAPAVRIVAADPAWWEPLLDGGPDGLCLEVPLPQRIATHELRLAVSDERGGQAELRPEIAVLRVVFVEGDLPAAVTTGDVVELRATAHNRTDDPLAGRLRLVAGEGLELEGPAERELALPPHGSALARFVVTAGRCGRATLRFELVAGAESDAEELALDVLPPGPPLVEQAQLVPGESMILPVEAGDLCSHAALHIGLPALAPFEQLAAWSRYRHGCVEQTASRVETAARVLRYAAEHGLELAADPVGRQIDEGVATLLGWQGPRGWSWYGGGDAPYLTSLVLGALLAAREAGRAVPRAALEQGLVALFRSKSAWHEPAGFGAGMHEALLLAEVLDALQAMRAVVSTRRLRDTAAELQAELARRLIEDPPSDPYRLAIAVLPLSGSHPELASLAAQMVLAEYHDGRRPRFDGPGGDDEALAAACRVLRLAGQPVPPELAAELSRPSADDLFNTRGLVRRTRALVELPPPSALRGTLSVFAGEELVRRVELSGKPPVVAALELAWIDLQPHLSPGVALRVEVEPPLPGLHVVLRTERWPAAGVTAGDLSRHHPAGPARPGDPVEVALRLPGGAPAWSVLEEPLPANARPDAELLDQAVRDGAVSAWSVERSTLLLYLERPPRELRYTLIAERAGRCAQGAPRLRAMYGAGAAPLEGRPTIFDVRPAAAPA